MREGIIDELFLKTFPGMGVGCGRGFPVEPSRETSVEGQEDSLFWLEQDVKISIKGFYSHLKIEIVASMLKVIWNPVILTN